MNRIYRIFIVFLIITIGFNTNRALQNKNEEIISWVDNQGYWRGLAEKGLVQYNPEIRTEPAIFTGSTINTVLVRTEDSPDVPVTEEESTQSENSVAINPFDETVVLNSNNSTNLDLSEKYGADALYTFDSGDTWEGEIEGAGENENGGDPVTAIGLSGRWFINFINSNEGMGVSYSDDNGETWTNVQAAPNPGSLADKCHMIIDNNHESPYEGNIYIAWTNVGGPYHGEIGLTYSSDNGETWTLNSNISSSVGAGSHNQGVNLCTGSEGELYAFWAIYDSWPSTGSDENAIGMAVSYDGGQSWTDAVRIIENIRGIRSTMTSKNLRVNSFPVAVVDNSTSADKGTVYVTWTNYGVPGVNVGPDIDIYLIKSIDYGETWCEPIRVNTDPPGLGKEHFMQWITCDNSTGILSMIFYDDRNVSSTQCETFCANSINGGQTWEDFKVSDVAFTPTPIPGLADNYMGDYLGIGANNGKVYPVWTDNRTGVAMSYCSPYITNPVNRPENLVGDVVFETGVSTLHWTFENTPGFDKFIVYRNGDSIASTTDTVFSEILTDYGYYFYRVTAYYNNDRESGASGVKVTWGEVRIDISPVNLTKHQGLGYVSTEMFLVNNTGQLPLEYSITLLPERERTGYCSASGGSNAGQEYIKSVEVGDISNLNTGNNNYTDYTYMSTNMEIGKCYPIKVVNGNPFDDDQCAVWVDWNIDELFDESEMVWLTNVADSGYFKGILSPPPGSLSGLTRMRVRLAYTGNLSPCGTTIFGEVEDYSINCNGWMDISQIYGELSRGNTDTIFVTYNTVNLPVGDYSCIANVSSNDMENPEVGVNISLRADSIVVNAIANADTVCQGDVFIVMAQVQGTVLNLNYQWYSKPEGFNSTKPRPSTFAMVPTWYFIEVSKNNNYTIDSVFIEVLAVPNFTLGKDTVICFDSDITLTPDNAFNDYLWSTGDTTRSITVDSLGIINDEKSVSLTVFSENGCSYTDEIVIGFTDCSNINEQIAENIIIYPNPATDVTYLSGLPTCQNFIVNIISAGGKHIDSKEYNWSESVEINLFDLCPGVYFIKVETSKNIIIKKLIKQ